MADLINKIKNMDWFVPESIIIFYIIFLSLAFLSFKLKIVKATPTPLGIFIILFGFAFFILGAQIGKFFAQIKVRKTFPAILIGFLTIFYSLVLRGFFNVGVFSFLLLILFSSSGLYYILTKIFKAEHDFKKFFIILLAISFIALPLSFFEMGGIPLQNFALRPEVLSSVFAGTSIFLFFFAYSNLLPRTRNRKNALLIIMLSTILFSLLAFRGIILVIFLAGFLILYYNKILNKKALLLTFLAAALIVIFFGFFLRPLLPPHELLLYRAGTTHAVYEKVVQSAYPFGLTNGTLFFQGETGAFISKTFFDGRTSLTATLVGPAFLDLGFLGVAIWMLFLGFVLKLAYISKDVEDLKSYYPLLFATILVMIETGLNAFSPIFFFVFLLAYFAKFLHK